MGRVSWWPRQGLVVPKGRVCKVKFPQCNTDFTLVSWWPTEEGGDGHRSAGGRRGRQVPHPWTIGTRWSGRLTPWAKLVHELRSATPLEQGSLTCASCDSIPDIAGIDRADLLGSTSTPATGDSRWWGGAVSARLRRPWPPGGGQRLERVLAEGRSGRAGDRIGARHHRAGCG